MTTGKRRFTKIAFAISLFLCVMWGTLGTGTSLAWFTDTTPIQKNVFHIGELDLEVFHRVEGDRFELVDSQTEIFDDEALYEPGYVQVVYLKIENRGDIPFDYKTAVRVTNYVPAVNMFGQSFNLQDYLKFGVVFSDDLGRLDEMLADRASATSFAVDDMPLNTYTTAKTPLGVGESVYMAIIVRMPEDVGNIANYRKDVVPKVELGIMVDAIQQGVPEP